MAELEELLGQLHRATLTPGELSPSDRKALTELSIRLSH